MVLVPIDTPGLRVLRSLSVFGYHDPEGHGELEFADVRVPAENIIAGEGMGFMIAQARLGPGRIHHCMRAIGAAERALELLCDRADSRKTFGKPVSQNANIRDWIAESRIELEMARLLVLKTAWLMDTVGNQRARIEIAAIKVAVPEHRAEGRRPRDPGPRRRRRVRRLPAGVHVRGTAHAAARRRPGRGPQAVRRPPGAPPPARAAGYSVTPTNVGSGRSSTPKRSLTPSRSSRASASNSAVVPPPRLTSASVCFRETPTRPSP